MALKVTDQTFGLDEEAGNDDEHEHDKIGYPFRNNGSKSLFKRDVFVGRNGRPAQDFSRARHTQIGKIASHDSHKTVGKLGAVAHWLKQVLPPVSAGRMGKESEK